MTPRHQDILKALRRYWYLDTEQLRDLTAPHDKDKSITRENLRFLRGQRWLRTHEVKAPGDRGAKKGHPLHVITCAGSAALARELKDAAVILGTEPTFRDYMSLMHYRYVASMHVAIDRALSTQQYVKPHRLVLEHEVLDPDGKDRTLHTGFPGSHVRFCPDSLLGIEVNGYVRALYFEYDNYGDRSPERVAHAKAKGVAMLRQHGFFTRHLPGANDFRVVAVCPYADFRDRMMRGFVVTRDGQQELLPGAEQWLFVDVDDVTATKFLHANVFSKLEMKDGAVSVRAGIPLVPPPTHSPSGADGGASAGAASAAKDVVV